MPGAQLRGGPRRPNTAKFGSCTAAMLSGRVIWPPAAFERASRPWPTATPTSTPPHRLQGLLRRDRLRVRACRAAKLLRSVRGLQAKHFQGHLPGRKRFSAWGSFQPSIQPPSSRRLLLPTAQCHKRGSIELTTPVPASRARREAGAQGLGHRSPANSGRGSSPSATDSVTDSVTGIWSCSLTGISGRIGPTAEATSNRGNCCGLALEVDSRRCGPAAPHQPRAAQAATAPAPASGPDLWLGSQIGP